MKDGGEAEAQYEQLAAALERIDAGWVVDEVAEVAAGGKTVLVSELPVAEQERIRVRLATENERGFKVGRLGRTEATVVPLTSAERLRLLVQAAGRVIDATARAHSSLSELMADYDLDGFRLEEPLGFDRTRDPDISALRLAELSDRDEELDAVEDILGQVLEA